MRVALLNASSHVADTELVLVAAAVGRQLARHFAPAWGLAPAAVQFVANRAHVPPGAWLVTVLDRPDEPDALGYHTDDAGRVFGRVFAGPVLQAGGSVLGDPARLDLPAVSAVVSHEVLELVADPAVDLWADGPKTPAGSEYSREVCDPVEADAYAIDAGAPGRPRPVLVSSFVFPEWFDPQTPPGARVDQLRTLAAPFAMSAGGYMVVRQGPGTEQAVYGARYEDWRRDARSHPASRRARRLARPGDADGPRPL